MKGAFAALAGFLACAPCDALALDPSKAITQYVHRQWSTADGLPQVTITAIAQTPDGFLWLGTQEGLVRFDGVTFRVFDRSNTAALEVPWITALLHEGGTLWIGTQGGGLLRYSNGVFGALTTADGLSSDRVQCLARDGQGGVWVGTQGGGLNHYTDGRFVVLRKGNGLPGDDVHAVLRAKDGTVWIGIEGGGLVGLADGRLTPYGPEDGLPSMIVLSVLEDSNGTLWVGTGDAGVARFRHGRFDRGYGVREGLPGGPVSAILEDRHGGIWLGTGSGLARIQRENVDVFTEADGLSQNLVYTMLEDREGDLWVGTLSGLNMLAEAKFTNVAASGVAAKSVALCVLEDRKGAIWVGGMTGLTRVEDRKVVSYSDKDGLPPFPVLALAEDRSGTLWVGTLGGGLVRLHQGRFKTLTAADGLPSNFVISLMVDRRGDLWVGTNRGLASLRDGTFTSYSLQGVPRPVVVSMVDAGDGTLWVGTDGSGLTRVANGKWFTVGLAQPPASAVYSLYQDPAGTLWIGTVGGGLWRLRKDNFVSCTKRDGLFDDKVLQIVEDGQSRLWIGSNRGVAYLEKSALEEFFEGRRRAVVPVAFGIADGLKGSECSGGGTPGATKTRDGRLIFSTNRGIVAIDPARTPTNAVPPPVYVEWATVDGKTVSAENDARLGPGLHRIEVRYTAPSFQAPEKVRFRYRLHGFDESWVEAGSSRTATYTKLAPGSYRFQVAACNNDGLWNDEGASWTFIVRPRFVQTPLFFLVCATGLGVLLLGVHALRLQRIRARTAVLAERTRIATEIHDTMAQILTGLQLHLSSAEAAVPVDADDARSHLAVARELARTCAEETRRAVAALRPQALLVGPLPDALRAMAETLAGAAGMEVHVEVAGRPRPLPEEIEHEFWHIAQETVTNAVRHSRARHLNVFLGYERRLVRLRVTDDGVGMPTLPAPNSSGAFGLVGLRERGRQRRWRVAVVTAPGGGTEISAEVWLPWLAGLRPRPPREDEQSS